MFLFFATYIYYNEKGSKNLTFSTIDFCYLYGINNKGISPNRPPNRHHSKSP